MFWLLLVVTLVTGAPFVTTWNTTSSNEIVSFPTIKPQTNVTIDWGDNTTLSSLVANVTYSSLNHTYATPGKHNVSILGEFRWSTSGFDAAARLKLLDIISWGDGFLVDQNSANLFLNCSNMRVSAPPNTQPVFLPGAVLQRMFQSTAFNSSLNWDLKNVTSLAYMFSLTPLNKPITFTNTQGVTTIANMFENTTSFNQPINFDCSNVTTLDWMFSGASSFNSALNLNNTQAVVSAQYMFYQASVFNQPINFSSPNLVTVAGMFWGASKFNQPVVLGTQKLTYTYLMFADAYVFNQPITFPVDYVTDMSQMFASAYSFNQPINFSSSSYLIIANEMFSNAASFNQPVIMATGNVTGMFYMFRNASSFASTVTFTSTSKVNIMVVTAAGFTQNLASWNTSLVLTCNNFCAFCGLPSFPKCAAPCFPSTRITTTEGTSVCNTRAPTAAPTAVPSTAVPTTTTPTATPSTAAPTTMAPTAAPSTAVPTDAPTATWLSLAPSTAFASVSAAKAADDCYYSTMAVLLCSLWVCLSV